MSNTFGSVIASSLLIISLASAEDWPQFHGPRRDNRSAETGLLKQWPANGPEPVWRADGLGHGYSAVAIADGLIYTTGDIGEDTVITALDLSGQPVWRQTNGPAYTGPQPGSRSTPTVAGGRLYHINGYGNLVCLDAKTGEPVWAVNFMERFAGREIQWGVAESPLVDGRNVICCPGGEDVFMAALDRDTGETRWTCTGVGDQHTYASPAVVDYGGLRQIVTMTAASAIGVAADTGRLLWQHPREAPYGVNCDTPLYHDGHLFLFTTWARGATKLRLVVEGDDCSVEEVWHTRELDNEHGGVMLVDGFLYGHADGDHKHRHLACLDAETGETMWTSDELAGQASAAVTFADGLLYVVTDRGEVGLVRPSPERLEILGRFQLPEGGMGPVWAYPVVCGGRLYLRHSEFLYVYDIRSAES